MIRRSLFVVLALGALLAAACSGGGPEGLDGFDTTTITIDDRALTVAVADTPEKRSQGLMGVTDLGGLDGMLFVFPSDGDVGFWMKNTLIPLDIAFFTANGAFVDRFTMQPCTEDPCPSYDPAGTYRYAVEAPAGDLAFVGSSSMLRPPG